MTSIFPAVVFLTGFVAALHGWGRLLLARCDRGEAAAWPYAVVVGMGTWLVAGGILNYFQLAHPFALDAILGSGLALWLLHAYRFPRGWLPTGVNGVSPPRAPIRSWFRAESAVLVPAYLGVAGVVVFLVASLLPAATFNIHDDFHTYMMRPVRMLQTGTLGGDPFDLLGVDSLGGQSFLQAFFVRWLPLDQLNGFDAVLCFALSAFLLIAMARAARTAWPYLWLALIVLVAVNPHYVNISSLYSATAMVLAIVYGSARLGEDVFSREAKVRWVRAVPVGLLLGSLVTLKAPFALFAAMYFGTYAGLVMFLREHRRRARSAVMPVAAVAGLAAAPWIGVVWPNYAAALHVRSPMGAGTLGTGDVAELFSTTELYWGNSYADFTALVLMAAAAAAVALYLHLTAREESRSPWLAPLFAACVASVGAYFGNMYVFGDAQMAVRYAIPMLIAVVPAALIVLGSHAPLEGLLSPSRENSRRGLAVLGIALIGASLFATYAFSDTLLKRIKRAHSQRTLLSFPLKDAEVSFGSVAMSDRGKEWARGAQATTEEGTAILAWMSAPFQLDFARNRIFVVMEPGLINPWLALPQGADPAALREYLGRLGIRYVMFEDKGPGITTDAVLQSHRRSPRALYRRLGERNFDFRRALQSLAIESRVLIHNDGMVLFDLQAAAEPR